MSEAERRRSERHVRKQKVRRRRNLRLLAGFLLTVFAVYGLIKLYNSPLFNISEIEVRGNKRVAASQIVSLSRIKYGQNLLRTPVKEAEERIQSTHWIEAVTVRKLLPRKLLIEVTERVPVAVVLAKGGRSVVDKKSFVVAVLPPSGKTQFDRLAKIEAVDAQQPKLGRRVQDEQIRDAVAVLTAIDPPIRSRVKTMVVGGAEELRIYLSNEIEIFFGSSKESDYKSRILGQILHEYASKKKIPVYIDVRTPRSPVTRELPVE